jgi:hypothetical protein
VTVRSVYVGELGQDGALDWGGSYAIGNVARRMGPFFPGHGARVHPCDVLRDRIASGALAGRQVDWGAVAAKATVAELKAFAHDCYGGAVPAAVADFLDGLDPSRSYALIGCEY